MSGEYEAREFVPGAGAPVPWIPSMQQPSEQFEACAPPFLARQAAPDYGKLGGAPDYGKLGGYPPMMARRHSTSSSGSGEYVSPRMVPAPFSCNSSGSGEFLSSPVLPMPPQYGSMQPPMMAGVVQQGVPSEVIDSLRAEAMSQAEHVMAEQRAKSDKQVHLARVRIAELEQRVKRAEADGDEMSARLTLVEVQKAEADKAREAAEAKLADATEGACDTDRVRELETELGQLRSENEEMEGLKKTVMTLANELKRRMKAESTTCEKEQRDEVKARKDLKCLGQSSPEDTDYVTDSRSGS